MFTTIDLINVGTIRENSLEFYKNSNYKKHAEIHNSKYIIHYSRKQNQYAKGNTNESIVVNDLLAKVGNVVAIRYEIKKIFVHILVSFRKLMKRLFRCSIWKEVERKLSLSLSLSLKFQDTDCIHWSKILHLIQNFVVNSRGNVSLKTTLKKYSDELNHDCSKYIFPDIYSVYIDFYLL